MEQLKTIGRELAMGSQGGLGWGSSKEFLDLVKAIGEAKSKAEEERIVAEEIETLKKKIAEPDVPRKRMREYIIRLLYVEMLGHDASFGYIQAVKMTHDDNLLLKRTGYLAVTLFLSEDHDLIILIVNTIQKDLRSDNYLVCCAALTAVCRLINEETIPAVLPQVVELLGHSKDVVRKKAVMALHRFYQRSPSRVSHLVPKFAKSLCDNDPSVMGASLCALFDLIATDAQSYRNLTSSFVTILKQVVEHRLPKQYDYHHTPAPFIQVKLLKILALLGTGEKRASENMYGVLGDVLKRADSNGNINNAIMYECICTITSIYPNKRLLESAAEITSKFLKSENHNLKYMGIDALGRVIKINPDFAEEHQVAVLDCLEDPDDTLKRKTLDLLYKMTKSSNVEVIVEHMISYMKTINDSHFKTEIASRTIELAERFAPSNQWFIQTMNQVFEHAGDLVPPKVAHDLMRLIAEGSGEEDEDSDSQLRSSAVESYLQILAEPKLPSVLLQVVCWVLGEYGTADGVHSSGKIITKLCDIAEAHLNDNVVKGYAITAITKLVAFEIAAGRRVELIPECQAFIEELSTSHSTDLQQRAYELQAMLGLDTNVIGSILPRDASCEDIEVDKDLSFLDSFVQSALSGGAKPYLSQVGAALSANQGEHGGILGPSLRFDPYEKPTVLPRSPPPTEIPSSSSSSSALSRLDDSRQSQRTSPYHNEAPEIDLLSSSSERLQLSGVQKKWGPINYASSSSLGSKEKVTNGTTDSGRAGEASKPRDSTTIGAYGEKAKPTLLEVSPEKQKLAASLFGKGAQTGGRGSRSSSTRKTHASFDSIEKKTPVSSTPSQSSSVSAKTVLPPGDLLDLSEDQPTEIVTKDPLQDLEAVFEPLTNLVAPDPITATAKALTPDLMSLFDAPAPTPSMPIVDQLSNLASGSSLEASCPQNHPLPLVKKGPSVQGALQKDALSRQVGVIPTGVNPNLFSDLLG